MKKFEDYLKVILEHEGGYTNHPNDPGGETKYGISLRFLKETKLSDGDIDKDGVIDGNDIKSLTPEIVHDIYLKYFWNPLKIDILNNELLKLHIFDHAVNAGISTAIKLLQRVVSAYDDGSLGPITIKAINAFKGDIVSEYKTERLKYYDKIIEKNPKLEVFRKGWINRVNTTNF